MTTAPAPRSDNDDDDDYDENNGAMAIAPAPTATETVPAATKLSLNRLLRRQCCQQRWPQNGKDGLMAFAPAATKTMSAITMNAAGDDDVRDNINLSGSDDDSHGGNRRPPRADAHPKGRRR